MSDEKIAVALPPGWDQEKPLEIVLREGAAPSINEMQGWAKHVSVGSIWEWVSKRPYPESIKENPGVVLYSVDPNSPRLDLYTDPQDKLAPVLTSKLTPSDEYTLIGINQDKGFTQRQLEDLTRKIAHCFPTVEDAKALIRDVQNFVVKYEQTVERADDRQGNTKALAETAIKFAKGELPKQWKLRLPLFKDTDPVTIEVEVEIDKGANNLPMFSFWSLDLELMRRMQAKMLIEAEVKKLQNLFPCLILG